MTERQSSKPFFVYCTTSSCEEAEKIATAVVGEGLAACANILPGMTSIYRWQGRVDRAQEAVLILKTVASSFDPLAARIRALHSYDCPCIIALPIEAGASDYLAWIRQSVTFPENMKS